MEFALLLQGSLESALLCLAGKLCTRHQTLYGTSLWASIAGAEITKWTNSAVADSTHDLLIVVGDDLVSAVS